MLSIFMYNNTHSVCMQCFVLTSITVHKSELYVLPISVCATIMYCNYSDH